MKNNLPPLSPGTLARLDIDLGAVLANLGLLRDKTHGGAGLAAVLKADAYGIGLAAMARLHQKHGTRNFFVATPDEGLSLRAILGAGPEIALLCGLLPGHAAFYRQHQLTPVLNSLGEVEDWQKHGGGDPAILHIDTGMRRLGLDHRETQRIIDQPSLLDNIRLSLVMSHFACADERDHPLTARQQHAFERISTILAAIRPGLRRSLCNSAGIFAAPGAHYDLVRPGMAVYGLNPIPDRPNIMHPVVTLRARILQIRDAQKGDSIGYSATYTCPAPARVATIALGYADGFLRSLSNGGRALSQPSPKTGDAMTGAAVYWHGQPCPILGRVSMDLVGVDVTSLSGPPPVAGDWVEIIGPSQDADRLAFHAGTIGYEILTGLSPRYARHYHGADNLDVPAVSG